MEKKTTIPSFFQAANKGFKILPVKASNGQVEFLVEGEDIDKALMDLYGNESVGVLDFIKALKGFRSSIFNLKA